MRAEKQSFPAPGALLTEFAPAERESIEIVREQRAFLQRALDARIIETIPSIVLILNAQRQIAYANTALLNLFKADGLDEIVGLRPGELFQCVHAHDGLGGCGTSAACRQCGAVRAILGAASGQPTDQEARVLVRTGGRIDSMNLKVHAEPLSVEGQDFVIAYISDMSDHVARELMERVFFHDILNALSGIVGATRIIHEETGGELQELAAAVLERAEYMIREVNAQRLLNSAEKNDRPEAEAAEVSPHELLASLARMYAGGRLAQSKAIVVQSGHPETTIRTDQAILYRVIENLLKNALEASLPGDSVTIGYRLAAASITFFVTNQAYIPLEVQHQIFQRAFSTKGPGRGLGTYGVKTLAENLLGGEVRFTSDKVRGTTFTVTLPLALDSVPESFDPPFTL